AVGRNDDEPALSASSRSWPTPRTTPSRFSTLTRSTFTSTRRSGATGCRVVSSAASSRRARTKSTTSLAPSTHGPASSLRSMRPRRTACCSASSSSNSSLRTRRLAASISSSTTTSFTRARSPAASLPSLADRVVLHFLPPYSPDHNRIERVWLDLHANVTRNHRCPTMQLLLEHVRAFLRDYNFRDDRNPSLRRAIPVAA